MDNESDNIMELAQEEEKRVKELNKQLEVERDKEHKCDSDKLDKIKRMSDVWDDLNGKEKNKILKECVEKIVITVDDIDIHFIDF